jgi:hypothetical protein
MTPVSYESLKESLARLPAVVQSIPDIMRNPAANPLQAAILLGIALLLALLLVLSVFLALMRPTAEEEALLAREASGEEVVPLTEEERTEIETSERVERRMSRLTVTSVILLAWLAVWIVTGVTTARREVCVSCHPDTTHSTVKNGDDPHADVACVDCHEGGGAFARISVNVVTRVEHVVLAQTNRKAASAFGKPIASDGCLACHRGELKGTYYDATLRVNVAHADPIAAGAECMDCHKATSGVVGTANVGMSSCLRCHDGKRAKADCSVCHVGDPSLAIRPTVAPNEVASVQVPNPDCSSCHKDMTKCNACHGIAMPHTQEFERYGHARAAVLDLWNNDLRVCRGCHFPGHNDCQQSGCHVGTFPSHGPDWRTMHASSWSQSSIRCSCHDWNQYDHAGMNFCQICHPTKPAGTVP